MVQRQNTQDLKKVKLPFFNSYSNRNTDPEKDLRFLNCFPESKKTEQTDVTKTYLVKRPGIYAYKYFSDDPARGLAYFNGKLYAAYGSDVYEDDPFGGTNTPVAKGLSMSTYTGSVKMILCNSAVIGDYLFICDGVDGWYIDTTGTVTAITDVDFPSPHVISPVFLDGYVILAKGSDLYSCDVDDPSSWNASNFVSAESFPDPVVGLARQNNQIVAFGRTSTEFFYNAANASGSPFNRNEAALIQVGCASADSICQAERYCTFVGQSATGEHAYWLLDGFQPKKVSDESVERIISSETSHDAITGFSLRISGHMFYLMNLPNANRTLLYDHDERLWHEWDGADLGNPGYRKRFAMDYTTDCENGFIYGQWNDNGWVVYIDPTKGLDYLDDNTIYNIGVVWRTNKIDMDTLNRKRLHSIRLFTDQVDFPDLPIYLYMSDNDYRDFIQIGNSSSIPMAHDIDAQPILYRLGEFRRRSFQFYDAASTPRTRYEAMELCYTEGIS